MPDIIDIRSSSDEADRFAQLWEATPDDDGDAGLLQTQAAHRALVIHAERV